MVVAPGEPVERGILLVPVNGASDLDELGIAQHHVEGGVPQEEPQDVHVAAVFQVAGGEVVAEAVGAAAGAHPGPALQAVDHDPYCGGRHRRAVVGQPDGVAARRPELGEVELQGFSRLAVDGHHPEFRPLAQDSDLLQLGVQLGELHVGQLLETQAGIDEDGDNGLVADAQVAVEPLDIALAGGQQGADLVVGIGLDIAVLGAGQAQSPRRAFPQVLLVLAPFKESCRHLEVVVHRARGGFLGGAAAATVIPAVGFGVQVVHEVAQVVAGQRRRRRPVVLGGEVAQPVEARLVVLDGLGGEASARPGGDVAARLHEAGDEIAEGEGIFR